MADLLRVWGKWEDVFHTDWDIKVYENAAIGVPPTSADQIFSGDPMIFRFGPGGGLWKVIQATECTLNLIFLNEEDFNWLIKDDNGDYNPHRFNIEVYRQLEIESVSTIYYRGILITDAIVDNLGYHRTVTITFSDRLNLLKEEKYGYKVDDVFYTYNDRVTLSHHLFRALSYTGFPISALEYIYSAINIYQQDMSMGSANNEDPLTQAWLHSRIWMGNDGQPSSVEDVLIALGKLFQFRILQKNGNWWVIRIPELQQTSIPYRKIQTGAGEVDYGVITPRVTVSTPSGEQWTDPPINRIGGEITHNPEWKRRELNIDFCAIPNLLSNLDAAIGWEDAVTPLFWTNENPGWFHQPYSDLNGEQKGIILAHEDTITVSFDDTKYIKSPAIPVLEGAVYTLHMTCGRKHYKGLYAALGTKVIATFVGTYTQQYVPGREKWLITGEKNIGDIAFGKVEDDVKDIYTNLPTYSVKLPPMLEDGNLYITIYYPWIRPGYTIIPPFSVNAFKQRFFLATVSIERTDENDVYLPKGQVKSIVINEDAYFEPGAEDVKISGGQVNIEYGPDSSWNFDLPQDKYYGMLGEIDGTPLVDIWDDLIMDDDDLPLHDFIMAHWHSQRHSVTSEYRGSFRGQLEPDSVLYIPELFVSDDIAAFYIMDDVEYHVKTGIWEGTWCALKDAGMKAGYSLSLNLDHKSIIGRPGKLAIQPNYLKRLVAQEDLSIIERVYPLHTTARLLNETDWFAIGIGDPDLDLYLESSGAEYEIPEALSTLDIYGSVGKQITIEVPDSNGEVVLTDYQYFVIVDGSSETVDVILPDPTYCERRIYGIKALDITNTVTLKADEDSNQSLIEGIDSSVGIAFVEDDQVIYVQSDGTDYHIVGGHGSVGKTYILEAETDSTGVFIQLEDNNLVQKIVRLTPAGDLTIEWTALDEITFTINDTTYQLYVEEDSEGVNIILTDEDSTDQIVSLKEGTGITVSLDSDDEIVIDGKTYTLTVEEDSAGVFIQLEDEDNVTQEIRLEGNVELTTAGTLTVLSSILTAEEDSTGIHLILTNADGSEQLVELTGAVELTTANEINFTGGIYTLEVEETSTGVDIILTDGDSVEQIISIENTDTVTATVDSDGNINLDTASAGSHYDSTPDSDHTVSGSTCDLVAGENLVFGDFCYIKSDGKLWKGDANAYASCGVLYMATATINADATGIFLREGFARDDTWSWTAGTLLFASETAGALTGTAPTTSGAFALYSAVAKTATIIDFRPGLANVENA